MIAQMLNHQPIQTHEPTLHKYWYEDIVMLEIHLVKLQFIYMALRLHADVHGVFNCSCCNKHRVQITSIVGANLTMGLVCPLSPHHPSRLHLHSALRHWTALLGWHQHPLVWRIFHSTLKKDVKGKLSFQVLRKRAQFNIDSIKKNRGSECNSINTNMVIFSSDKRLGGTKYSSRGTTGNNQALNS